MVGQIQTQKLKLTIELIPSASWYNNIRKVIPKAEWDNLRRGVYAKYGYRCGICGMSNSKLSWHEVWEYDDYNHKQKLVDFIALCDMCHHVKHIGFAAILASQGKLDYEKVVKHFMEVNGCSRKTFEEHKKQAFIQWEKRSRYKWTIDLNEFEKILL